MIHYSARTTTRRARVARHAEVRLAYNGYATDGELGTVTAHSDGMYTIELHDGGICYRERDQFTVTGWAI